MKATKLRPGSRRAQVAAAEKILVALLRSPKSRSGLIAAVAGKKISRHFVFGWISRQLTVGAVAQLKSTFPPMFQLSECVVEEHSAPSQYPSWLDPRQLPPSQGRRVFAAGRPITEGADDEAAD